MNLEVFQYLHRNLGELTRIPEKPLSTLVVATDFEGPLILNDTAAEVMSRRIRPSDGNKDIDYGRILYGEIYNWYTEQTKNRRKTAHNRRPLGQSPLLAQEGTDITFALAPLIAADVTESYIHSVAQEYSPTPGSDELIDYIHTKQGRVIAVTTAWQEVNSPIAQKIGVDALIGTPFPIDQTVSLLDAVGRYEEEVDATVRFLDKSFSFIDELYSASPERKRIIQQFLHNQISLFYEDTLGISYDLEKRKHRDVPYKTVVGAVIESIGVVGDRTKAAIALSAFRNNAAKNARTITMGDGLNDATMLDRGAISIGLNGPDAVKAAKIGVITNNVRVLIPLFEILEYFPDRSLNSVIHMAQKEIGNAAIIHRGGPDVSADLLLKHKYMKNYIRQKAAFIP